jgi:hypothetical protein
MILNLTVICQTRRTTDGGAVARVVTYLTGVVLTCTPAMARIVAYFAAVVQASEIAVARVIADTAAQALAGAVPGAGALANERLFCGGGRWLGGEAIGHNREEAESQKENGDPSLFEHALLLLRRTRTAE